MKNNETCLDKGGTFILFFNNDYKWFSYDEENRTGIPEYRKTGRNIFAEISFSWVKFRICSFKKNRFMFRILLESAGLHETKTVAGSYIT